MLSKAMKLQETSTFIMEWLKAPLVTASVIPSSKRLASKMVQDVLPDSECVIELGPGTGVFTRQLLQAGVREEALVLVELNNKFAANLRKKYPKATVINGAAEALARFQVKQADIVISGLPLLSIRDRHVDDILKGVFAVMKPDSVLVQFTYGYKSPVKKHLLEKHHLQAKRVNYVINNFPPASVYHISRKPSI